MKMRNRFRESWNKPYKEAFAFMDACLSDGLTLQEGHKLLDKAYAVLNDVPLLDVPKSKAPAKKLLKKEQRLREDHSVPDSDELEAALSNIVEELPGTRSARFAKGLLLSLDYFGEIPYIQIDVLTYGLVKDGYSKYVDDIDRAINA